MHGGTVSRLRAKAIATGTTRRHIPSIELRHLGSADAKPGKDWYRPGDAGFLDGSHRAAGPGLWIAFCCPCLHAVGRLHEREALGFRQ